MTVPRKVVEEFKQLVSELDANRDLIRYLEPRKRLIAELVLLSKDRIMKVRL